jgi:uncharacterized membrane protein YsdA (DUF1294 family)
MPSVPGRSASFAKPSRRPAPPPAARRGPERRAASSRPRFGASAIVILLALAAVPGCALVKLGSFAGWHGVVIYACAIFLLTSFLYRKDKQQAERGGWRTPEATLHAVEFFGGWPAAFVAQRWYRHKIAKGIYQVNFWAIVLLHQFVALDYLRDWRFSQAVMLRLDPAQLLK